MISAPTDRHTRTPSPQARGYRSLMLPTTIIGILAALIINDACAPLYTPNAIHGTLAAKQGTVQGGVYVGAGWFNSTLEATPVDNITLLGSYSYEPWSFTGKPLTMDDSAFGGGHMAHSFWETGMGYSIPFGPLQLDLIGGYGAGHASALWPKDPDFPVGFYPRATFDGDSLNGIYRVDGDYKRIFLQTTLSGKQEEALRKTAGDAGVALRTSYLWFTELTREDRSTLHPRALFFDPVAFVRGGTEHIQIELQGGFSVKVPLNHDQLRVQVIFLELGVHGVLDGLW